MPNHVTNKIVFSAEHAENVFQKVCPNGKFDFNMLVPMPMHVYRGNLSQDDEKDFIGWYEWSCTNWGTKWNCYAQACDVKDGVAFIEFDTAWSVPYPVIVAFANTFEIEFEYRYFDEGHNFWGVEKWKSGTRISKDYSNPSMKNELYAELKGYVPEQDDE